MHDVT